MGSPGIAGLGSTGPAPNTTTWCAAQQPAGLSSTVCDAIEQQPNFQQNWGANGDSMLFTLVSRGRCSDVSENGCGFGPAGSNFSSISWARLGSSQCSRAALNIDANETDSGTNMTLAWTEACASYQRQNQPDDFNIYVSLTPRSQGLPPLCHPNAPPTLVFNATTQGATNRQWQCHEVDVKQGELPYRLLFLNIGRPPVCSSTLPTTTPDASGASAAVSLAPLALALAPLAASAWL